MKKRGQFFLIAALLISGMTIGFGTLYNEGKIERQDAQVYEFTEELHSELQQVYDSGTVSALSPEEINQNIQELVSYYASQNPDSNFVILYGNENNISEIRSDEGKIESLSSQALGASSSVSETGSPASLWGEKVFVEESNGERNLRVRVNFEDKQSLNPQTNQPRQVSVDKTFKVKPGQNFYLVVRKKVKNEQVIISR